MVKRLMWMIQYIGNIVLDLKDKFQLSFARNGNYYGKAYDIKFNVS